MELKIRSIKITKINFERFSIVKPKEGQILKVKMKMEVIPKSFSKIKNSDATVISDFIFDMEHFAKFVIETQMNVNSKEIDEIISYWEKDAEKELPPEVNHRYVNALFFYVMPQIISIAEKAKIPVPLPPLVNHKLYKKVKQS